MKKLQVKLNYANVIATIALFVALGGSAYAASALPKNSVGTKQLRPGSVTTAKIKNGAITGPKVNLATLGTVPSATSAGRADVAATASRADVAATAATADVAATAAVAANASNASALGGNPPSAFALSSVVRSATVDSSGVLVPAKSEGIAKANLGHNGEGLYCINGLNPAPRTAVASVDLGAEQGSTVATGIGAPSDECQVSIYTYSKAATDANRPFSAILH